MVGGERSHPCAIPAPLWIKELTIKVIKATDDDTFNAEKRDNSEKWNNNLVSPFYRSLLQNDREHIYKYNTTIQWFEAVRTIIQSSMVYLISNESCKTLSFLAYDIPTTTNGKLNLLGGQWNKPVARQIGVVDGYAMFEETIYQTLI